MFKVNSSLEDEKKMYLNEVSEDGIWKGLRLKKTSFVADNQYINLEFQQESTGYYTNLRLYSPKAESSEKKIAYDMSVIEHVFKALVSPKRDSTTGKDIRFGISAPSLETFEDVYKYYSSKIVLAEQPLVDIKGLYKSNIVGVEKGKPVYPPKTTNGDMPYITSEFSPRNLDITKDLSNVDPKYNKYLKYTIEELESFDIPGEPDMSYGLNSSAPTSISSTSFDSEIPLPF